VDAPQAVIGGECSECCGLPWLTVVCRPLRQRPIRSATLVAFRWNPSKTNSPDGERRPKGRMDSSTISGVVEVNRELPQAERRRFERWA